MACCLGIPRQHYGTYLEVELAGHDNRSLQTDGLVVHDDIVHNPPWRSMLQSLRKQMLYRS